MLHRLNVCLDKQTGAYISAFVPFIAFSNNMWVSV